MLVLRPLGGAVLGDPYMADCRCDGRKNCHPDAARGCAHWMRETGVDDDAWSPAPLVLPWSREPKPRTMTAETYAVVRQIQAAIDAQALRQPSNEIEVVRLGQSN